MDKNNTDKMLLQSHCRWELSTSFVKMIATQHKLPNLNNQSLNMLACDCTFQLFTLVSCAKKIANLSRREHLKSSDIVAALKMCEYDGLYGSGCSQMGRQLQLASAGTGGNKAKGMLSYVDKEFDLDSFLSQPPVKLPREVLVHEHWLSINGVVPDIPENTPQLVEENVRLLELAESSSANSFNYQHPNPINDPSSTHPKNTANPLIGQPLTVFSDRVPLLIERQLVYKELTEACFGPNENRKKEALVVMSTDLVMKELTPHFACFVRETVRINVTQPNLGILLSCVRMIKAIFDNIHLKKEFMQNQLHYFVPSLLNCIVSRRICVKSESENHWALRCFASKTLATICSSFQSTLPTLSLRVCNIAKRVIESCKTYPTAPNTATTNDATKEEDADVLFVEELTEIDEHSQNIPQTTATNTNTVDVDSIPFSSYYGAATLLFDLGVNVAKFAVVPLLPKLGNLIETTLASDDASSHELAKYEATFLKELLIKQTKYIVGTSVGRFSDDIVDYCASYGDYIGSCVYKELIPMKTPSLTPTRASSCASSGEKPTEENKHVL